MSTKISNLKKLGAKVQESRKLRGLSQAALAATTEIDVTLISKIENGRLRPTQHQLQEIVDTLRIGGQDALDIWSLSGRGSGPVVREQNKFKEKDIIMDSANQAVKAPEPQLNVSVNPQATQILFSDAVGVTTNDFGMVFDFAQRVSTTNSANVVARVGVSHEHARKIMEAIRNELDRNEK